MGGTNSLPEKLIAKMNHVALRGRQIPEELTWFDWLILKIGGLTNKDSAAGKKEFQGFDFMYKATIKPILQLVAQLKLKKA